jgi:membrane dipeptidase
MNCFDLHCDTAGECFQRGLNLAENDLALSLGRTARYEKWAQIFAVWIDDSLRGDAAWDYFRGAADNFARQLAANAQKASFCRTGAELQRATAEGKRAALLSAEGSAAFGGSLERLREAKRFGLSLVTLTWNGRCEAGDGCGVPEAGGLTPFGFDLLREMEHLGVVADVSHLSETGFWDVARAARRPFAASHSDSAAVWAHRRNLTDAQFREIAQGGGLVGLNFFEDFLRGKDACAEDVVRHAEHFLELGGEDTLALGSDFDGGTPCAGLARVEEEGALHALFCREFGRETADRIFWGNAYRFFRENLP